MSTTLSFPGITDKNYGKNIVVLTRSDRNKPATGFLKNLEPRAIVAVDFDTVKDDFCKLRDSECHNRQKLKSVDAFFMSTTGRYYFIEFKKASSECLSSLDEGEPIDVSFRKKAFDSILMSRFTVVPNVNSQDLMSNATLIVVYKSSASDAINAIKFDDNLTRRANGNYDSMTYPIKWKLDELKTCGLYKEVYTWPDNKFESWAIENLT